MINVTPIAITATSQEYACSVVENLCQAYCLAQSIQPQSAVSYSIASQETISGTTFVTVQATGTVTYQPRNGKCCCKPQVKMFTESFDIIFKGNGSVTRKEVDQAMDFTYQKFVRFSKQLEEERRRKSFSPA